MFIDSGEPAKLLEVVKDLPPWLLAGLFLVAGILLRFPPLAVLLPGPFRPWIVFGGVVSGALTVDRATRLLAEKVPGWRAAARARRRFYLNAIPQQSFWSGSKQADDSIVT
jgi:hypothetical protein